ncbi:MAG: FAD:protein FMN transferase [Verrucomicrobiae bacterium]|nr:FAD:protein FMN transferase [Verrucomicrobiae bacterium]MCP5523181.1 FAD:protein FMN transferase [Verrucomicrobiales bacterium]
MQTVSLAREAMATRFELVLNGSDPVRLRSAGEGALDEVDRQEARLSLYRATSEISQVNRLAAGTPVTVSPPVFSLLEECVRLWQSTGGAFDITVAPLMRAWGFLRGTGRMPTEEAIMAARAKVGMQHIRLDAARRTVHFEREGMMLDLGAIGKGYAIDEAVGLLRDDGVVSAFFHGGTSTCYALGRPPAFSGWRTAITRDELGAPAARPASPPPEDPAPARETAVTVVELVDASLSVSAVKGKAFESDGRVYGHVIDPRTGWPVQGAQLAAVVGPGATKTDALSTALLVLGEPEMDRLAAAFPRYGFLSVTREPDGTERIRATEGFSRLHAVRSRIDPDPHE